MAETLSTEQLEVLDTLYTSGFMSEAEAEDYREAFLRVTFNDLMSPVDTGEARPVKPWFQGGAARHSIGRPSLVKNGDRPRVNPPTTYKDRFRRSGAPRWTRNSLIVGQARLNAMVEARVQAWDAIPEPKATGCDPSQPFDSDNHGSSDGRHAVCPACSQRLGRVVVGQGCSCVTLPREAYVFLRDESGEAHRFAFDRITGEVEGTPGYYVGTA